LTHSAGSTSLIACAQLSPNQLDNQSWHILPSSLPQHSPRHLINAPPTPTILVTEAVTSHPFAPPQAHDLWDIYPDPTTTSSRSPNNTNFHLNFNSNYSTMGETLPPPVQMTIQVPPMKIKHERSSSINSNSNIPTPVSMAGHRSPLSSPTTEQRDTMPSPRVHTHTHSRRISEDSTTSSQDSDDNLGSMRKNHSYKRSEEPPRNSEAKMICKHEECAGLTFDRKCEWR
jgi:hypothetical protein